MDNMEGVTDVVVGTIDTIEKQHTAKEMDTTVCHLLRIPAEIRLQIYRYLLLPEPSINLEQVAEARRARDNEDEWVDEETGPENGWEDTGCVCGMCEHDMDDNFEDGLGLGFGCVCGQCVVEPYALEDTIVDSDEDMNDSFDDDRDSDTDSELWPDSYVKSEMYMNILRVNRQIYHEASSLFYAEAELVLGVDDILCLEQRSSGHREFFLSFDMDPPDNVIWRYNPLKGIGKRDEEGVVTYESPPLEGLLDPHVFARFQKLSFEICFDEDYLPPDFEIWINDDTLELNQSEADEYKTIMERSTMIRDIVKIISESQNITHLSIKLEAGIGALSANIVRARDADDDYDSSIDNEDDEERQAIEDKADKTECAANEKAAELLVESNLFDPLLQLSNVKNFKFEFQFYHEEFAEPEDPPFKPQQKTMEKIAAMKALIEDNYKKPDPDALVPKENAVASNKRKGKRKRSKRAGRV